MINDKWLLITTILYEIYFNKLVINNVYKIIQFLLILLKYNMMYVISTLYNRRGKLIVREPHVDLVIVILQKLKLFIFIYIFLH